MSDCRHTTAQRGTTQCKTEPPIASHLAKYRTGRSANNPVSIENPMSELATDLLHVVSQLASAQPLPLVRQFELPPQSPMPAVKDSGRTNNFAALVLEDGSVGMTYVALDQALQGLRCSPCLLYTSPSPRDQRGSRMPSSA